jgi:hypothetical protein
VFSALPGFGLLGGGEDISGGRMRIGGGGGRLEREVEDSGLRQRIMDIALGMRRVCT